MDALKRQGQNVRQPHLLAFIAMAPKKQCSSAPVAGVISDTRTSADRSC